MHLYLLRDYWLLFLHPLVFFIVHCFCYVSVIRSFVFLIVADCNAILLLMFRLSLLLLLCGYHSPNGRSFRGPGGVGRDLNSGGAVKICARGLASVVYRCLPWSPSGSCKL